MFATAILIIAVLVLIGALITGLSAPAPLSGTAFLVAAGAALVAVLTFCVSCLTIVSATDVGVPVAFGRVGDALHSGFHVKAPWSKVETFPIRPFPVKDQQVIARTGQAGQVTVHVGARWHVVADQAGTTYLQVRTGDEDVISTTIVDPNLATAVGNVYVRFSNITATTDRTGAEQAIRVELDRLVGPYGVTIDNVTLRAVEPDRTTSDALARVASQQRSTEIAHESVATAVQQAKARLVEAQGLKQAAAALPKGLTPTTLGALCALSWERMAQKAIEAGVPTYTGPCGSNGSIVPAAK